MAVISLLKLDNTGNTCTAVAYEWAKLVIKNKAPTAKKLASDTQSMIAKWRRLSQSDGNAVVQARRAGLSALLLKEQSKVSAKDIVTTFERVRKKHGKAVGLFWYKEHTCGYADLGKYFLYMDNNEGIWFSDSIDEIERFLAKKMISYQKSKFGFCKGFMIVKPLERKHPEYQPAPPPPPAAAYANNNNNNNLVPPAPPPAAYAANNNLVPPPPPAAAYAANNNGNGGPPPVPAAALVNALPQHGPPPVPPHLVAQANNGINPPPPVPQFILNQIQQQNANANP